PQFFHRTLEIIEVGNHPMERNALKMRRQLLFEIGWVGAGSTPILDPAPERIDQGVDIGRPVLTHIHGAVILTKPRPQPGSARSVYPATHTSLGIVLPLARPGVHLWLLKRGRRAAPHHEGGPGSASPLSSSSSPPPRCTTSSPSAIPVATPSPGAQAPRPPAACGWHGSTARPMVSPGITRPACPARRSGSACGNRSSTPCCWSWRRCGC